MKVVRNIKEMQEISNGLIKVGKSIGFVPTMGFLHEGHLSLVRMAKEENDTVVVSIFVNPLQFGPREDFKSYPRDEERDLNLLKDLADFVFIPEAKEMYPEGYSTYVEVEKLTTNLCGRFRPGHFKGVTTVVLKLFNIVKPTRAYFGKKDYQQFRVIERMALDLNLEVKVVPCEIFREKNGLAMSSRNVYLTKDEFEEASIIYKALSYGKELIEKENIRDPKVVIDKIKEIIQSAKSLKKIDYIQIVDPITLQDVDKIEGSVVILFAGYFGNARLIDNVEVNL
ncbi:MAG: pantoate--beta-alanine ligase [Caldisericaceae bacterium]